MITTIETTNHTLTVYDGPHSTAGGIHIDITTPEQLGAHIFLTREDAERVIAVLASASFDGVAASSNLPFNTISSTVAKDTDNGR
jgi:hypothetical protein